MPFTLKVELIYFAEQADLRLEFSIGGDGNHRILTSQCHDLHEYLMLLKRAVSRNHITFVLGGYQNSVVDVTGRAVSRPLSDFDYEGNGYTGITHAPARLPQAALPLMDSDKCFAGFAMQSGPQAIVLLDEQYPDRARLAKELILPYVNCFYEQVSQDQKEDTNV